MGLTGESGVFYMVQEAGLFFLYQNFHELCMGLLLESTVEWTLSQGPWAV